MTVAPQPTPRIFLSYSNLDRPFAKRVRTAIESSGYRVWQDITHLRGGDDWRKGIRQQLSAETTEYLVLALTQQSLESPGVAEECQMARQEGVVVIPVAEIPFRSLKGLPKWIERLTVVPWHQKEQRKRFLAQLSHPAEKNRIPFAVEALPENLVERPEELTKLKSLLLTPSEMGVVGIRTAIRGAGGYGKTTLALCACHDSQIRNHFVDGILWLTLGERQTTDDLLGKVIGLIELLTGRQSGFTDLEVASHRLADVLGDREILLVIDDVWRYEDVRPFLRGGTHCVRLLTSRNTESLPENCQTLTISRLRQSEALQVLGNGVMPNPLRSMSLYRLSLKLRGWALILRIVNGVLRERVCNLGEIPDEAINQVDRRLEQKGFTAFDQSHRGRQHAVAVTLSLSTSLLRPSERERFSRLAVFPEDTVVPLDIVRSLWRLDSVGTDDLCAKLARLSLIESLSSKGLRLHDAIRATLEFQNKPKLRKWHGQLVSEMKPGEWWQMDLSRAYCWDFLGWHLCNAGKREEWSRLLLDYRYLAAKMQASGVFALISDFGSVQQSRPWSEIADALKLSVYALAPDPKAIGCQLLARIPERRWSSRFRRSVERHSNRPCLLPVRSSLTFPGGPLLRTLEGQFDPVRCVAMTKDTTRAVSGAFGGSVMVWDLETGSPLEMLGMNRSVREMLATKRSDVNAVVLTPDERWAVLGLADGSLEVWDFWTGEQVSRFGGHKKPVTGLAMTTDGIHLLSCSEDRTIKIWHLDRGVCLGILGRHKAQVTSVAISRDGRVVTGTFDGKIRITRMQGQEVIAEWQGHADSVLSVAISAQGKLIFSSSYDGEIRVWDSETHNQVRSLKGHLDAVGSIAATEEADIVVTGSHDCTVGVWNLKAGINSILRGHSMPVNDVRVNSTGTIAVSASDDQTLKVWNLRSKYDRKNESHQEAITCMRFAQRETLVVTGAMDRMVKVWETKTGRLLGDLGRHDAWIHALVIDHTRDLVISATDMEFKVWDLQRRELLYEKGGIAKLIQCVGVCEQLGLLLSSGSDGFLRLWKITDGSEAGCLESPETVTLVDMSPDGLKVIAACGERVVFWDLIQKRANWQWKGGGTAIHSLELSPTGRFVAAALGDGTIHIRDVISGRPVQVLRGHRAWISFVTWVSEQEVLSGSADGTVRLWRAVEGTEKAEFKGHGDTVNTAWLGPKNRFVISASRDKTLRLWDMRSRECVSVFHAEAALSTCRVTSSGVAIAGDEGGGMHFLKIKA